MILEVDVRRKAIIFFLALIMVLGQAAATAAGHDQENNNPTDVFAPSALDDIYVDDDWVGLPGGTAVTFPCDSLTHTIGLDAFDTIAAGLNAVVPGGRVLVAPGTYNEMVEFGPAFNKNNVTLMGACWTDLSERPVVTTNSFGSLFFQNTVLVYNITISGIIFTNGVRFANTGQINGLEFSFCDFRGAVTVPNRNQIFTMQNPASGPIADLSFSNCLFDGENVADRVGYYGGRPTGDLIVNNCEFRNILGWALFEIDSGAGDGSASNPLNLVSFGGNHVHHSNGSVALRGHRTQKTLFVMVFDNIWDHIGGNQSFQGEQWAAVEINHAQRLDAHGNVFDGVQLGIWGEGQAMQLWDIDRLDIYCNTIINNYQGIWIFDGDEESPYGGPYAVPMGVIQQNVFCANQEYAVSIGPNCTGGPLNITNNWWGSSDGPSGAFSGNGQPVFGNVNPDPWLTFRIIAPNEAPVGEPCQISGTFRVNSDDFDTTSMGYMYLPDGSLDVTFETSVGQFGAGITTITVPIVDSVATANLLAPTAELIGTVCAASSCEPDLTRTCTNIRFFGNVAFEIVKKAAKYAYASNEIITYTITVKNVGTSTALTVTVTDAFPKDLEFISSRPSGSVGQNTVKFSLASLPIGGSTNITLLFRLAKGVVIQEAGKYIQNQATVSGKSSIQGKTFTEKAMATIFIVQNQPGKELSILATWNGLNSKTSSIRTGEELDLVTKILGGSSPYKVRIEWSDGQEAKYTADKADTAHSEKHVYNSAGTYMVTISCEDNFGRATRLVRTIKVN